MIFNQQPCSQRKIPQYCFVKYSAIYENNTDLSKPMTCRTVVVQDCVTAIAKTLTMQLILTTATAELATISVGLTVVKQAMFTNVYNTVHRITDANMAMGRFLTKQDTRYEQKYKNVESSNINLPNMQFEMLMRLLA